MRQNSIQLIGYVGQDPIVKAWENGNKKARLRVATHQQLKTPGNQKVFATTWHEVVAWDHTADYAERSFVKGSHILVDGSIVYRTYSDANGHTRYVTEIKADTLINLDR